MKEIEENCIRLKRLYTIFPLYRLLSLLVLVLFLCISWYSDFGTIALDTYSMFGAPFAVEIYEGHYWGVISNSLIHINITHLLINLVLLAYFGRTMELRSGPLFFFLFGLGASIATSTIQLAMAGDAGIGLTGVNFALIGYYLGSPQIERPKALAIFIWTAILILFSFAVLNLFYQWYLIGLSAIISGFILAHLLARTEGHFWLPRMYLFVLFGICISSLFYNPYSSEWQTLQGFKDYEKEEYASSLKHYKKAIHLSDKNVVAKQNLEKVKISLYEERAYKAHKNKEYVTARKYYLEILSLDPKNQWAISNMRQLP